MAMQIAPNYKCPALVSALCAESRILETNLRGRLKFRHNCEGFMTRNIWTFSLDTENDVVLFNYLINIFLLDHVFKVKKVSFMSEIHYFFIFGDLGRLDKFLELHREGFNNRKIARLYLSCVSYWTITELLNYCTITISFVL